MYESYVAFMPLDFILLDGSMKWKMDACSKVLPYPTNYDLGKQLKIFLDLCYNQLISVRVELKRKMGGKSVDMDIIFIFIAQRRRAQWGKCKLH